MPAKGSLSARNTETRKKKKAHAIPRAKVTRSQGNTPAVRNRLRKLAAKAANAKQKAAASS